MTNQHNIIYHSHDVLIIGAGGAGLRAAIAAADKGADVAVISKVAPFHSHTAAAQGGINAALGNVTPDDWRWHMYDTVKGSAWLGDQDAIAYMCKKAPEAIKELEEMGMPFTRDDNGEIYQRQYGGTSTHFGKGETAHRACAATDQIGNAMMTGLTGYLADYDNINLFVEFFALDLLMDDHGTSCKGILAWELATGSLHVFLAHETIIATGGYGQVFSATTSSSSGTGDGGAMTLRASIPLEDMEYVQFHPTGLFPQGILISEAARGEGGYLLNGEGERFMQRYAPKQMELASRDVVSRAIISEITAGRGAGKNKDHVLLDVYHLGENKIESLLPTIRTIAKWFTNHDMVREAIPVLPTVHYTMGGIPSNRDCEVVIGQIGNQDRIIHGLRAIGEAACNSIHGANRLGCNSLLDLVVFGKFAGEAGAKTAKNASTKLTKEDTPQKSLNKAITNFDNIRNSKGHISPRKIRLNIQQAMQKHCGLIRDKKSLEEGMYKLRLAQIDFESMLGVNDNSMIWNNNLVNALETQNILQQALVTIASATNRTESRGAHYRSDYPTRNDQQWTKHSLSTLSKNGEIKITTRPVRMESGMENVKPIAIET